MADPTSPSPIVSDMAADLPEGGTRTETMDRILGVMAAMNTQRDVSTRSRFRTRPSAGPRTAEKKSSDSKSDSICNVLLHSPHDSEQTRRQGEAHDGKRALAQALVQQPRDDYASRCNTFVR